MAKTLSEAELNAANDNAVLTVIDTCGKDLDSATSKGLASEYLLGSTILAESEKVHLVEGEKLTGDQADKSVAASIKKSRNAIVDGLIESGRFDFGRTKYLDAVRVASKFSATDFENLATEFNRTAIIELASVADDKVNKAVEAVRAATKKAEDNDNVKAPNVRELVKSFKPTARKSSSVPFPLKVAEGLAETFDVEFFAKLTSEKGLTKKAANEALIGVFGFLAQNGIDAQKIGEAARATEKAEEVKEVAEIKEVDLLKVIKEVKADEVKADIENIKTPEGEDFSYGSEAYEKRRAELVAEGLGGAI